MKVVGRTVLFGVSERLFVSHALSSSPYCTTLASFLALTAAATTMVYVGPFTIAIRLRYLFVNVGAVSKWF